MPHRPELTGDKPEKVHCAMSKYNINKIQERNSQQNENLRERQNTFLFKQLAGDASEPKSFGIIEFSSTGHFSRGVTLECLRGQFELIKGEQGFLVVPAKSHSSEVIGQGKWKVLVNESGGLFAGKQERLFNSWEHVLAHICSWGYLDGFCFVGE